jgi:predicted ester cyclase
VPAIFNVTVGRWLRFPGLQCTIDDVVAEGDKVALRWIFPGTHKGDLLGKTAELPTVARQSQFSPPVS